MQQLGRLMVYIIIHNLLNSPIKLIIMVFLNKSTGESVVHLVRENNAETLILVFERSF